MDAECSAEHSAVTLLARASRDEEGVMPLLLARCGRARLDTGEPVSAESSERSTRQHRPHSVLPTARSGCEPSLSVTPHR